MLPLNVVNPPVRKWEGVVNIDSVKIEPSEVKHERPRRFNNGLKLFNIHSWAPLDFDPNNIFDQDDMRYRVGFTLISQSLLSNMMSHLSYGWTHEGGSRVSGQFQYYGFAPKIEVGFRYGGGYSSVMGGPADVPVPPHKRYFSLNARVFLPFNLSGGYWQSQLTPLVEISHNNHRMYNPGTGEYSSGYQRLLSRLQFAANVRMSERDFLPRWGVLARITNVNSPFTPRTSNLWSLLGRVYTPGIVPHHSIMLRAAVHTQTRAYYSFTYKDITPRGTSANFAARRYLALSGDYQFTAWCPDWGINSILFFRRIRVNMGYDFARYQSSVRNISGRYTNLTSYGGDVYFDLSPLRTPDRTVTVGVNVSKPSDRKGVVVGFDLNIPL